MRALPTFSSWDEIQIGAVSIKNACPLDPEKCRKNSQPFLCNLGTRSDYWKLAQRQFAFQAGNYTVLQVGNVYARKLGRTVKQQIVEQWSLSLNLRHLVVLWGLQISLYTGIAIRVFLRKLIEDLMFAHVDNPRHAQWHRMLPNARAAFRGSIDLKSWIEGLSTDEKICLIAIIASCLNLLKDTGSIGNASICQSYGLMLHLRPTASRFDATKRTPGHVYFKTRSHALHSQR